MKTERIMTITRDEVVRLIERKYGTKFWKTRLSHEGFRGWEGEQVTEVDRQ